MQVVHAADLPWMEREERHRDGSLAFKNLFKGDEGDPNNFRWVLSRNSGTYRSPHHRHNFDQVRFCVEGTANIAPGKTLNKGDVGYLWPAGGPRLSSPDARAAGRRRQRARLYERGAIAPRPPGVGAAWQLWWRSLSRAR
jgi:hypothetical protein